MRREARSMFPFWITSSYIPFQVMAKYKAKVEGTDKKAEEEGKEE